MGHSDFFLTERKFPYLWDPVWQWNTMPAVWFLLSKIVPLSLLPILVLCYGYSVYSMSGSSSKGIVRYAVIDFTVFLKDRELRIFLSCYSEPSPYHLIFALFWSTDHRRGFWSFRPHLKPHGHHSPVSAPSKTRTSNDLLPTQAEDSRVLGDLWGKELAEKEESSWTWSSLPFADTHPNRDQFNILESCPQISATPEIQ